jgi:hypothetical protein
MGKFVTGVVLGVFVGALAVEVLERTYPELRERIRGAARRVRGIAWEKVVQAEDSMHQHGATEERGYY